MKQHEAVILALDKLGGIATLGQLYTGVFKVVGCEWGTKTPLASIRRIVQTRKEIYKIKPGLYGLLSRKSRNDARGFIVETEENRNSKEFAQSDHYYYQGMLLDLGKLRGFGSWVPAQDQNKMFLNQPLASLRTFKEIPAFSFPELVSRSATIDVIWFNQHRMPHSFFEIEHSTDIQNSLLKFNELQDFNTRMIIVSSSIRKREYEKKKEYTAFKEIKGRVKFLDYDWLVKTYEHCVESSQREIDV